MQVFRDAAMKTRSSTSSPLLPELFHLLQCLSLLHALNLFCPVSSSFVCASSAASSVFSSGAAGAEEAPPHPAMSEQAITAANNAARTFFFMFFLLNDCDSLIVSFYRSVFKHRTVL